jgi:ribosomal protein L11 methyltransferase
MYLWRRLAGREWLIANEEKLRSLAGDQLAIVERLTRKRLEIEVACKSAAQGRRLVTKFGGVVKKLPREWLKLVLSKQKTKSLKIGDTHLMIPAGMAFGTGTHATTAMSLRFLKHVSRKWKPGWSLVDLGTGSGILALAAKLLGAKRAIGLDIDPIAISTAKGNARRNKINNVSFRLTDARRWKPSRKIDIVTANLFSELLIEILPKLKRARWLILSGILREQERGLVRALKRNKINVLEVRRRGKWVAVLATVS